MNRAIVPFYQILTGFQASQVLYVLAKFGFADYLKDGPKSGDELASLAKTHAETTTRVLRAAAGLGILERDPATLKYQLNDVSKLLLEGPTSLKYSALHMCEEKTVRAWCNLDKAVETGVNPFQEAFGVGIFDYLQTHPESANRFNRAMTSFSASVSIGQAITEKYGLQDVKQIVDIGGGQGLLTAEVLRLNPHLTGVSFDLPSVVDQAKEQKTVDLSGIESRFSYSSGSFFESVPSGADLYTLKAIIHDWNDEDSLKILKTVRNAMLDHSKVLVLDLILQEVGDTRGAMLDLHMKVVLNAKERTEEEFRNLFDAAGLKLTRTVSLAPIHISILEAVKK